MKETARAAPLLVLLLLAGCSSSPTSISSADYYELTRAGAPIFAESTENELDNYAQEICGVMRKGDSDTSWLLGVKYLTDAGMDAKEAGGYLVYAASYRCPEMLERFPDA